MYPAFNDSSPRLRIADVLLIQDAVQEQKNDGELLPVESCTGVVSRWLSRFRAAKLKKFPGQVDESVQDATSDVKCSTGVFNCGDSPCTVPRNHQLGE